MDLPNIEVSRVVVVGAEDATGENKYGELTDMEGDI